MSNRRKTPDPTRRAPQHREGRGRHREPAPSPGSLIAVPGQAGVRILAVGALGSAAAMSLSAGVASAATASGAVTAALTASVRSAPAPGAPAPISGGNATFSVTNGQPSLSFNLKTPFGQTPNLTVPTVTPFQPAPLQFTLDPAGAINSDPVLRSLPGAIAAQQAQQALSSFVPPRFDILPSAPAASSFGPTAPVPLFSLPGTSGALSPATPSASPGPIAPFPFAGMSAGSPDLLTAAPAGQASGPAAPVGSDTVPAPASQPSVSLSGRISGAFGLGGTAGLACDNGGNCALTLGGLVGVGGGASLAISPNPAPTTLNVDLGAQTSAGAGGYFLTGGVSGSLTNFTGLQAFGRVTTPGGEQVTVSGTIPPSVLAGIGLADSNAAAAEAGLPVIDQPVGPPTPNQQVSQAFADLAAIGGPGGGITIAPGGRVLSFGAQTTAGLTVTIPITRDYLNQVGQALGNAEMVMPVLPDPALSPAQRIDQGFSAVGGNDVGSVVQQDFAALAGSGTGAGGFNILPGPFPVAPVSGQQAPVPYITDLTTPNGNVINPLTGVGGALPGMPAVSPFYNPTVNGVSSTGAVGDTAPGGNTGAISRGIAPADPAAAPAPAASASTDQAPAPAAPVPAPADQAPAPAAPAPGPADQPQSPAPGPQTQVDPAPAVAPDITGIQVTGPDTTASGSQLVATADPTAVGAAPAAPAPAPVSAGLGSVGPVASGGGGGFSGGGFSGGGSA